MEMEKLRIEPLNMDMEKLRMILENRCEGLEAFSPQRVIETYDDQIPSLLKNFPYAKDSKLVCRMFSQLRLLNCDEGNISELLEACFGKRDKFLGGTMIVNGKYFDGLFGTTEQEISVGRTRVSGGADGVFDVEIESSKRLNVKLMCNNYIFNEIQPKIQRLDNGNFLYKYDHFNLKFVLADPVRGNIFQFSVEESDESDSQDEHKQAPNKIILRRKSIYLCLDVRSPFLQTYNFMPLTGSRFFAIGSLWNPSILFDLSDQICPGGAYALHSLNKLEWKSISKEINKTNHFNRRNQLEISGGPCVIKSISKVEDDDMLGFQFFTEKLELRDVKARDDAFKIDYDFLQKDGVDVSYQLFNDNCPNFVINHDGRFQSWGTGILSCVKDDNPIPLLQLTYPLYVLNSKFCNNTNQKTKYQVNMINGDTLEIQKSEKMFTVLFNGKVLYKFYKASGWEKFTSQFDSSLTQELQNDKVKFETLCIQCPSDVGCVAPSLDWFTVDNICHAYTNGIMIETMPPYVHFAFPSHYVEKANEILKQKGYIVSTACCSQEKMTSGLL